jgi:hypothetical protein
MDPPFVEGVAGDAAFGRDVGWIARDAASDRTLAAAAQRRNDP